MSSIPYTDTMSPSFARIPTDDVGTVVEESILIGQGEVVRHSILKVTNAARISVLPDVGRILVVVNPIAVPATVIDSSAYETKNLVVLFCALTGIIMDVKIIETRRSFLILLS